MFLVDQRAVLAEKGQIALVWAGAKGGEVVELLNEYQIGVYFEEAWEGLGRSLIWVGDAAAELVGMRWCCLKVYRPQSSYILWIIYTKYIIYMSRTKYHLYRKSIRTIYWILLENPENLKIHQFLWIFL